MIIKIKSRYQIEYQTDGSACVDLVAAIDEPLTIPPFSTALVPTGLYLDMPNDIRAEILSRSGMALASQTIVLNAPGIIDSDYRGEIKVILMNLGMNRYTVEKRQRIAQLGFTKIIRPEFTRVSELNNTERGDKGFGSTGV